MKNIRGKTYIIAYKEQTSISIKTGILGTLDGILKSQNYSSFVILTDEVTNKLFGKTIIQTLQKLKIPIHTYPIPVGEQSKQLESIEKILTFMAQNNVDRKSACIALGGGVVGDIATMASGIYHRGINCIQIPTTLLSQVDSSVGGKGGVNLGVYKNIVGVVRQPRFVIIDPTVLKNLPKNQITSGMGEIVKYAIAFDKVLFDKLSQVKMVDNKLQEWIIKRCIELKMETVQKDPFEHTHVRMMLNFGHTLGHAVETLGKIPHGNAVAIGMVFAIEVSRQMKLLDEKIAQKALDLIRKFDLPESISGLEKEKVIAIMKKDKKSIAGDIRLVLLKNIGEAYVIGTIDKKIFNRCLNKVLL